MISVLLGIVALVLGLWALRAFANADPAAALRALRQGAIVFGVAIALLLLVLLLVSGRLGLALGDLGAIALVVRLVWAQWRRRRGATASAPGQTSAAETDYVRMRLDHDSGTMTGTVRRGAFQGRDLAELSRDELLALWRECRAEDEQGAALLEAYLDRLMPDWRQARAQGAGSATAHSDAMTPEEALAVLGLSPGADKTAIRDAHRRLMMKLHPDHGGSSYLAAKLNRAREVLLDG
jgi:hypothetical protein